MPWTVTTSEAYATVVRPSLEDTAAALIRFGPYTGSGDVQSPSSYDLSEVTVQPSTQALSVPLSPGQNLVEVPGGQYVISRAIEATGTIAGVVRVESIGTAAAPSIDAMLYIALILGALALALGISRLAGRR